METTKKHFLERINKMGILFVRERNCKEDYTGWGALEFILNNGEVFVVSGERFGQGSEENGLWIDMNKINDITLKKLKQKALKFKKKIKNSENDTIISWLKHQNYDFVY